MNILLFKKDLDHFSDHDILSISKMYNFSGNVKDLRWLIAIKHSQKAQMLSGGIMSFSEKLPQLQKVAKERNDASFPVIDSSFIDKLLQLVKDQRQFKKDLKRMTREEKQVAEKGLTERENYLKNQPGWRQTQELREKFNVKQQYFDWVIKSYLSGSINKIEDILSRLNPAIVDFEWLKKNNKIDKKIKLQQLNGLKGLEDFLDQYEETLRERRGELADVEKGRQGGELLYDGKDIKIINPTTEEGACYYGKGTRWCTAATESENMFEEYNKEGPLYIIQPKTPGRGGREKYQLHFETDGFMNEKDEEVELTEIYKKYPEILVLRKYSPKILSGMIKKGDDLEKLLSLTKDSPITDDEASLLFNSEKVDEKILNYLLDNFNVKNKTVLDKETFKLLKEKDMLDKITVLKLSHVRVDEILHSLYKLKNLRELSLTNNRISVLPESIGSLSNLEILDLSNYTIWNGQKNVFKHTNKISEIPDFIGNLSNLEILRLDNNQIRELPESIGKLSNLKRLQLPYNKLSELPESISKLSNLKTLDIPSNQISEIPDFIGNLSNLEYLRLHNNQIRELPESISKLSNLKTFDIHHNQISEIPDSIGNLSNLEYLRLDNNQISKIPSTLEKLTNLSLVDLRGNPGKFPDHFGNLSGKPGIYYSWA